MLGVRTGEFLEGASPSKNFPVLTPYYTTVVTPPGSDHCRSVVFTTECGPTGSAGSDNFLRFFPANFYTFFNGFFYDFFLRFFAKENPLGAHWGPFRPPGSKNLLLQFRHEFHPNICF